MTAQDQILQAAEALRIAYDNLRAHDASTVEQYQYRPLIHPRTGQVQSAYRPQPQERRDLRKQLIVDRDKAKRELFLAVQATCENPTIEEVRAVKFTD